MLWLRESWLLLPTLDSCSHPTLVLWSRPELDLYAQLLSTLSLFGSRPAWLSLLLAQIQTKIFLDRSEIQRSWCIFNFGEFSQYQKNSEAYFLNIVFTVGTVMHEHGICDQTITLAPCYNSQGQLLGLVPKENNLYLMLIKLIFTIYIIMIL